MFVYFYWPYNDNFTCQAFHTGESAISYTIAQIESYIGGAKPKGRTPNKKNAARPIANFFEQPAAHYQPALHLEIPGPVVRRTAPAPVPLQNQIAADINAAEDALIFDELHRAAVDAPAPPGPMAPRVDEADLVAGDFPVVQDTLANVIAAAEQVLNEENNAFPQDDLARALQDARQLFNRYDQRQTRSEPGVLFDIKSDTKKSVDIEVLADYIRSVRKNPTIANANNLIKLYESYTKKNQGNESIIHTLQDVKTAE